MKKEKSYYLSEKQIKRINKGNKGTIIYAVLMLFLAITCGIILQFVNNDSLELVLTAIIGISGIGCVLLFLIKFPGSSGHDEKAVEREETGYFGEK